jgi:hypothetical protein
MIPVVVVLLAVLCLSILVHRYRVQERKHERQVLKRLADNYVELHKRL